MEVFAKISQVIQGERKLFIVYVNIQFDLESQYVSFKYVLESSQYCWI